MKGGLERFIRRAAFAEMMFDHFRFSHEDYLLGNVGCQIGNTLEVSAHTDELKRRFNGVRILMHDENEIAHYVPVQIVDHVVIGEYCPAEAGIVVDESIDDVS
jgi:hypothetical protein